MVCSFMCFEIDTILIFKKCVDVFCLHFIRRRPVIFLLVAFSYLFSQLFISARYGAVQRLRMFIELDILFLLVTKPSQIFMFNHILFNRGLFIIMIV